MKNYSSFHMWFMGLFCFGSGLFTGSMLASLDHSLPISQRSEIELDWIATCTLLAGHSVDYCQQQSDKLRQLGYYNDVLVEDEVEVDIKVEQN